MGGRERGREGGRNLNSSQSDVKTRSLGFRGGAVVKNPPANAGDTGSIPHPGRSHMLRNN